VRNVGPQHRLIASLACTIVLFACSSGGKADQNKAPIARPTSAPPPPQTLPGESVNDATFRIEVRCFGKYGISLTKDSQGGITFDLNPGTTPTRSAQNILDECLAEVNRAGLNNAPPRTEQQLAAEYQRWVQWAACLNAAGYQVGSIVSYEEYVAGNTWPAPGYITATKGFTEDQQAAIDSACEPPVPIYNAPSDPTPVPVGT
jgi:hypothetical protein